MEIQLKVELETVNPIKAIIFIDLTLKINKELAALLCVCMWEEAWPRVSFLSLKQLQYIHMFDSTVNQNPLDKMYLYC